MTTKSRMHFTSGLLGALILAVVLPAPGSAQQSGPSGRTAQSDQTTATRPAPKLAKPRVHRDIVP